LQGKAVLPVAFPFFLHFTGDYISPEATAGNPLYLKNRTFTIRRFCRLIIVTVYYMKMRNHTLSAIRGKLTVINKEIIY